MGVLLVQEAEPFLEAALVGGARCVRFAEAPFADETRLVTGGLEELADRRFIGGEGHQSVAADADMPGVAAGHEHGTARSADGTARVALGEAHPFGGQAVEVRSLDALLPVATQFPVTEI